MESILITRYDEKITIIQKRKLRTFYSLSRLFYCRERNSVFGLAVPFVFVVVVVTSSKIGKQKSETLKKKVEFVTVVEKGFNRSELGLCPK